MKKLLLVLIPFVFCSNIISQESILWTRNFETNLSNYYESNPTLKTDVDTIIVTGVKNTASGQRLIIVKYNIEGDTISTIEYGKDSVMNNTLMDYKFDNNNHIYLLQNDQFDLPRSKIVIQKYTIEGKLEWVQQIKPTGFHAYEPHSLGFIDDTCLFVSAYKLYNEEYGGWMTYLPYLYAYNTNGNKLWEREFNKDTEIDWFSTKLICYQNIAYLFDAMYADEYRVLKIDANNNITINTKNGIKSIHNVYLTSDTNFLITPQLGYNISKTNLDGTVLWSDYYGTNLPDNVSDDEIIALIQDTLGNIYITGRHYGTGYNTEDYTNGDILTIKYNKEGELIWENRYKYNGNNCDIGRTLFLKDNYLYVGGQSQRLGIETDYDYIVLKIDKHTGSNKGTYRYNGNANGDDVITSLSVFNDGKLALTGLCCSNSSFDWTTQLLSNFPNTIPQIKNNTEIFIFPNPVNKNGILNISSNSFQDYFITDINGRMITGGSIDKLNNNRIPMNNFAPNIYFITFKNNSRIITKEIIVK